MEQAAIPQKIIHGGCYCKRVEYQVQLPVKWCAHCHCQQCRHLHGAPITTWFGVDKKNFTLSKGQLHIAWFQSSETAKRGHCIQCGTPLFFETERSPNEIHIVLESTQDDIQQAPQIHVFYDRHVDYLSIEDSLEKFGGPDGFSPLLKE